MRYRPCPTCGTPDRLYVRQPGFLTIVCAWCGDELHGIAVHIIDGEAINEAA